MVVEQTMYTVVCDSCGEDAGSDSDYSCWNDPATATERAVEDSEWAHPEKDKHYCKSCFTTDEDGDPVSFGVRGDVQHIFNVKQMALKPTGTEDVENFEHLSIDHIKKLPLGKEESKILLTIEEMVKYFEDRLIIRSVIKGKKLPQYSYIMNLYEKYIEQNKENLYKLWGR